MAAQTVYSVPPRWKQRKLVGASKGVSLSTTVAYTLWPFGTEYFSLVPRNYSTAVVARWQPIPFATILRQTSALTGGARPTDLSFLLQDGDNTATATFNSFPTLANGGAIYVGCTRPFRALYVDVQNTNSTSATLTAVYPTAAGRLTSLTITDNTASGGATFAQDGTITWTVPNDWASFPFNQAFPGLSSQNIRGTETTPLYWARFVTDTAWDSTVSVNQILALAQDSAYNELADGWGWNEMIDSPAVDGEFVQGIPENAWIGVEALTDAGTANLLVEAATNKHFVPVAVNSL